MTLGTARCPLNTILDQCPDCAGELYTRSLIHEGIVLPDATGPDDVIRLVRSGAIRGVACEDCGWRGCAWAPGAVRA